MRTARRLDHIPGFNIDRVAAAAGDDPDVLRLENLDTDIPPLAAAIEATRAAVGADEANSWLPFNGREDLKEAVAGYIGRRGGPRYDPRREVVITCGEGEAMLDALLCLTDPGDEVILTDPTYAGMLNRVRLAGAAPRLVPMHSGTASGAWTSMPCGRRDRPHPSGLSQQRLVSHRLGGVGGGVGCGRGAVPRARALAALLGRLRGGALRRSACDSPGGAPRHARPDRDRGRAVVGAAHDRVAGGLGRHAGRATDLVVARRSTTGWCQRLRPDRNEGRPRRRR